MRGRPSLLLVYMGLATCLDTSPHREQNQGALLGKLYVQWQGRTGLIIPLSPQTPQSPPLPPGLPTYEQALAASGVHDAPPPPYSSLRRPH
ncbi:proline-rich Gla (G-carboxyglutamic acid) polypeptide 2, isoform CRA_a [Mus musculus]|uniref:Proline-rich Gla (G-carboxyglutamic acid) polypeptide 2 n=1 Tax=Mus musculus TaxID=10090 RepID=A0A1B0GRY0_MOUSE|nr:proline-rich Gla (G-carboxyglutamic acid) polypeptide 2, isoform CRA_a [Mus musculus]